MSVTAALPGWVRATPWHVVGTLVALGGFGVAVLYSAAGGSFSPWALNQGVRLFVLLGAMLVVAQVPLERWLGGAYWIYGVVLVALIGVEALGAVVGGSQRWLDLGIIRLQPSEFMKLAVILALARYFHHLPRAHLSSPISLIIPLALIAMPVGLVVLQPDLGTAMMILGGGAVILFLSGMPWWWFAGAGAAVAAAVPVLIGTLHDYQRRRVSIFLDPEADPLGAGYHITQSKIAIGSGGLWGKGFGNGTQGALQYLPEHQTDFVFATMAEEWGVAGGVFVLACYGVILWWGMSVALSARTVFARLAAAGLACTLFYYVAINLLMVMGLAPVVGIPLPLVSYGGSAMMTVLLALGILVGLARERDRAALGRLAPP